MLLPGEHEKYEKRNESHRGQYLSNRPQTSLHDIGNSAVLLDLYLHRVLLILRLGDYLLSTLLELLGVPLVFAERLMNLP